MAKTRTRNPRCHIRKVTLTLPDGRKRATYQAYVDCGLGHLRAKLIAAEINTLLRLLRAAEVKP